MNIYVGNLPFELEEDELRSVFEKHGEVTSVKIISDQYSGKSRGFGFVEMSDSDQGQKAVSETNGADFKGRSLKVSEARPRTDRMDRGTPYRGGY